MAHGVLDSFERAIITQLLSVLAASERCEPGARLDSLAMSLGQLTRECEAYAGHVVRMTQSRTSQDTLAGMASRAVAIASAARDVENIVRVRALTVKTAAVEALWRS